MIPRPKGQWDDSGAADVFETPLSCFDPRRIVALPLPWLEYA